MVSGFWLSTSVLVLTLIKFESFAFEIRNNPEKFKNLYFTPNQLRHFNNFCEKDSSFLEYPLNVAQSTFGDHLDNGKGKCTERIYNKEIWVTLPLNHTEIPTELNFLDKYHKKMTDNGVEIFSNHNVRNTDKDISRELNSLARQSILNDRNVIRSSERRFDQKNRERENNYLSERQKEYLFERDETSFQQERIEMLPSERRDERRILPYELSSRTIRERINYENRKDSAFPEYGREHREIREMKVRNREYENYGNLYATKVEMRRLKDVAHTERQKHQLTRINHNLEKSPGRFEIQRFRNEDREVKNLRLNENLSNRIKDRNIQTLNQRNNERRLNQNERFSNMENYERRELLNSVTNDELRGNQRILRQNSILTENTDKERRSTQKLNREIRQIRLKNTFQNEENNDVTVHQRRIERDPGRVQTLRETRDQRIDTRGASEEFFAGQANFETRRKDINQQSSRSYRAEIRQQFQERRNLGRNENRLLNQVFNSRYKEERNEQILNDKEEKRNVRRSKLQSEAYLLRCDQRTFEQQSPEEVHLRSEQKRLQKTVDRHLHRGNEQAKNDERKNDEHRHQINRNILFRDEVRNEDQNYRIESRRHSALERRETGNQRFASGNTRKRDVHKAKTTEQRCGLNRANEQEYDLNTYYNLHHVDRHRYEKDTTQHEKRDAQNQSNERSNSRLQENNLYLTPDKVNTIRNAIKEFNNYENIEKHYKVRSQLRHIPSIEITRNNEKTGRLIGSNVEHREREHQKFEENDYRYVRTLNEIRTEDEKRTSPEENYRTHHELCHIENNINNYREFGRLTILDRRCYSSLRQTENPVRFMYQDPARRNSNSMRDISNGNREKYVFTIPVEETDHERRSNEYYNQVNRYEIRSKVFARNDENFDRTANEHRERRISSREEVNVNNRRNLNQDFERGSGGRQNYENDFKENDDFLRIKNTARTGEENSRLEKDSFYAIDVRQISRNRQIQHHDVNKKRYRHIENISQRDERIRWFKVKNEYENLSRYSENRLKSENTNNERKNLNMDENESYRIRSGHQIIQREDLTHRIRKTRYENTKRERKDLHLVENRMEYQRRSIQDSDQRNYERKSSLNPHSSYDKARALSANSQNQRVERINKNQDISLARHIAYIRLKRGNYNYDNRRSEVQRSSEERIENQQRERELEYRVTSQNLQRIKNENFQLREIKPSENVIRNNNGYSHQNGEIIERKLSEHAAYYLHEDENRNHQEVTEFTNIGNYIKPKYTERQNVKQLLIKNNSIDGSHLLLQYPGCIQAFLCSIILYNILKTSSLFDKHQGFIPGWLRSFQMV